MNTSHGLIVVNANSENFHTISLANKYLLLLTEYQEADLCLQNLQVILPQDINAVHEQMVRNYIEHISSKTKLMTKEILLKNKDEII